MSEKEEGMRRAVEHANDEWKDAVEKRLRFLTRYKRYFTSDDVLVYLSDRGIKTHNNSALGGLVNGWANRGYIKPAGFTVSRRPSRHQAPIRLWKSNFYHKEVK